MIKLLRLDERLIHGQVAIKWSRHTGVDRIVVINDAAANNEIVKKSLLMAAPQTAKVAIKGVKDGITLLKDSRCEPLKILVIVSSIEDVLTILDNIQGISDVNVGNYGRIAAKQEGRQRTTYAANLYLYENEVTLLKEVASKDISCTYQTTPEDTAVKIIDLLP